MARLRIRYLTTQPAAAGGMPRYFWQPSGMLRAEGWRGRFGLSETEAWERSK